MLVSCFACSPHSPQVVGPGVLADDHALIDLHARLDEERAALLEIPERVGHRVARAVRDENAVAAAFDFAAIGLVGMEDAVHHAGAARVGQELAVIADQAARGAVEDDARLARTRRAHVDHLALAVRDLLDDDAGIFVVDVHRRFLDGFEAIAVLVLAVEHARPRDRQFEAFAAHVLDQHAELQFAASRHFEGVAALAVGHLDRDIRFRFLHQPLADHARLHLVAFAVEQAGCH